MEPALIIDKLKSFAKSGEDFITGFSRRRKNKSRQNPIEILKRLQREAFSDLMKLRDRQDKVERMLTFSRTSKGSPFQDDGTNVRGEIDMMGSLFFTDYLDQENVDAIRRAGVKTGINARISFETKIREKDNLEAVFIANQIDHTQSSSILGSALSLAKVSYTANITDWCSMVAIPMGARCRDLSISTDSSFQEKGLTDYSSSGPPLLHQDHGRAIGLTVKKSNVVASLAHFVVDLPGPFGHCFSTFGQIVCQLPRSAKLSLFGLHQVPKPRQQAIAGALTIPLGIWSRHQRSEESNFEETVAGNSVAVMLESELDESSRVRGWLQMKNGNPKHLQWSVSMSDFPEDEIGWGLSLGGTIQGPKSWDHFQVEAFLKFNVGKRLSLQPAFVYLMDGNNQVPALMCRSTWSI
ncbi:uncharacterized protein [Spinacia oleracea]|uniref:Uncharacterized protein isoform X1 n=2 Tax=Spinacia oleracea TaxID=3562 RepID=A0A9R0IDL9_SPIOL|nr:uncharacterized protein LOC110786909 isoform X1 [Spinacia oleracea]XP_056682657.1 uncharacterized protein LOC110786909 isoform X1 [Spinacia oleracea]